jgi:hypothetical protein
MMVFKKERFVGIIGTRPSSKSNGYSEADRCGKDLEGRGHRKIIKWSRYREALNVSVFSIYHQVE